jgi:hypothetical protein
MKEIKTYIKCTRFGAKGRTPSALNRVEASAMGENVWILGKIMN